MSNLTAVTLFSGGGLSALGARSAGYDLVGAVEYAPEIAAVYAQNLGDHVTVGKVEDVNPSPYIGIDALLASPVCSRASVANADRGESEVDTAAAEGVCRWLRVCRPRCFVMENVTQYRAFESYRLIMATLYQLGYLCTDDTCNSADWGVPQTRRRMIVRALLGQMPPKLTPTHYNPQTVSTDGGLFEEDTRGLLEWVGWYAAIEDILDTLPEGKFADWQLKRLGPNLFESMIVEGKPLNFAGDIHVTGAGRPVPTVTATQYKHNQRAFLTDGFNGSRDATVLPSEQPAMTVHAGAMRRPASTAQAWLEQGRVVTMTSRALARFQSLPDWYTLPTSNKLASTIIGNGVACLLSEAIMRQLKEA